MDDSRALVARQTPPHSSEDLGGANGAHRFELHHEDVEVDEEPSAEDVAGLEDDAARPLGDDRLQDSNRGESDANVANGADRARVRDALEDNLPQDGEDCDRSVGPFERERLGVGRFIVRQLRARARRPDLADENA